MDSLWKHITLDDFRRHFGVDEGAFPELFRSYFAQCALSIREPTREEIDDYLLMVLKLVHSSTIKRSMEENLAAWEKGWAENLEVLKSCKTLDESIKPRYFRGSPYLRYDGRLVMTGNLQLEYDLFVLQRLLIFNTFLSPFDHVYEFGCGTCHNLIWTHRLFPEKKLHALDWAVASTQIAELLRTKFSVPIEADRFDMLRPEGISCVPNSCLMTVHAMEQIGEDHRAFVDFLVAQKPGIVIHLEPILELYDQEKVLDYLAWVYSKGRNYLSGLLPDLQRREREGQIEILAIRRPHIGGVVHEASLIVWKPKGQGLPLSM